MQRLFGILGVCALLLTIGCRHVGGKCDCGPSPGDASSYTPMSDNYGTVPSVSAPISTTPIMPAPKQMTPLSSAYESLGMPKEMPKGKS